MVREGSDFVIFAHGILVYEAIEAANALNEEGISVRVVNVSSLKPVDEKEIKRFCEGMRGIVTAEEHSIIGGLGDIVSAIMKGSSIPMEAIGIHDQFGQSAQSYRELLEHYGLTSKELIEAVRRLMRWK